MVKFTKSRKRTKTGSTTTYQVSRSSPNKELVQNKTRRQQTRHETMKSFDQNATARQAQRQMTKRATAKYNAASRATLYGSVGAASAAEDATEAAAEISKYSQPKVITQNPKKEVSTVSGEPDKGVISQPKSEADSLIDVTINTTPGTNPSTGSDDDERPDRGKFETFLYN